MKRKVSLLLVALLVLLSLCGCTPSKKEEETSGPVFDLAGKTYYNTVDNYGHEDHSKVWFGKDGSFVMNDSYPEGYYDITGTWALNEDVCTLTVDSTGVGSFSKIIFEVKDDDTLTLKTSLEGSKSDESFSTTETKGSSVSTGSSESGSGSEGGDGFSEVPPADLTHERIPCTGLTSLYKNYWAYEGVKDYDLEVKATPENTTDGITYTVEDESVVKVDVNGHASTVGPGSTKIHIKCGDIERVVNFEVRVKGATSSAATYTANIADVNKEYQPSIYLDGAGNFDFTENCYAGMGHYKGTYKIDGDRIYCTVTDAKSMQGFAGDDVTEIVFKIIDDKTLKLKTDLCMSTNGVLFYAGS